MQSWKIIRHTVLQLTGNLPEALRLSVILYIPQIVLSLYMTSLMTAAPDGSWILDRNVALYVFAGIVVAMFSGGWIAVGWHRFILLGERPRGIVPKLHSSLIWGYIWRGFLIFLVLFVPAFLIGFVAGIVVAVSGSPDVSVAIVPLLIFPIGMFLFYRLSPILPAAAIGQTLTLKDAWRATRGSTGPILSIVVLYFAYTLLMQYLFGNALLTQGLAPLNIVWSIVTGWIGLMLGVSLLTTIYGHYVEGRALL